MTFWTFILTVLAIVIGGLITAYIVGQQVKEEAKGFSLLGLLTGK